MHRDSVVHTIKTVLAEVTHNPAVLDVSEHSTLRDDLGVDSMTALTFLMALEDSIPGFIVDADTLEPEHFRTIGSISDYVIQQLAIGHEAATVTPV